MQSENHEEIILEVARLIRKHEISIGEFYTVLGVDIENPTYSDLDNTISQLAGIFAGWNNPT
ncbi:hypothetical protein [Hyphobacterium indicum]|uniref:hypothetical protein n=1 Tax=Hyphobacterium indicum TaxID=2162714 RepID=UPI000D64E335|nr:hypothetical protein [Hyphobacterium indicum]